MRGESKVDHTRGQSRSVVPWEASPDYYFHHGDRFSLEARNGHTVVYQHGYREVGIIPDVTITDPETYTASSHSVGLLEIIRFSQKECGCFVNFGGYTVRYCEPCGAAASKVRAPAWDHPIGTVRDETRLIEEAQL